MAGGMEGWIGVLLGAGPAGEYGGTMAEDMDVDERGGCRCWAASESAWCAAGVSKSKMDADEGEAVDDEVRWNEGGRAGN